MGIYPEVINENLSYFEPMLNMDSTIDLLELVPVMKQYVIDLESQKAKVPAEHKEIVVKKDYEEFTDINDFIYKKMTIGGIFNRDIKLSEKDIKIMKHLLNNSSSKKKAKKRSR